MIFAEVVTDANGLFEYHMLAPIIAKLLMTLKASKKVHLAYYTTLYYTYIFLSLTISELPIPLRLLVVYSYLYISY